MKQSALLTLLALTCFWPLFLFAQSPLIVKTNFTPDYLIRSILLNDASSITVSNVKYNGDLRSLGGFSNSSKYYLMKRGIILSTGNAEDGIGPNSSADMGLALGSSGSLKLDAISSERTFDACELTFDFVPSFDSINFNFIFASEEYPEYVNKGVNDIFGFFIEDLSSGVVKNLATVGIKKIPVNVDNINDQRNAQWFIKNGVWDPQNIMQWKNDPGLGELALTYEYDGFTTILNAGTSVVPGRMYRITFAIADAGDRLYDSAVFLEAGSFVAYKEGKDDQLKALEEEIKTEFTSSSITHRRGNESIILSFMIHFETDEFETDRAEDIMILNKIERLLKIHETLAVRITGHTDNTGDYDYNRNLSQKRAVFAEKFLERAGIEASRLSTQGMGDEAPLSDNVTKSGRMKNRRIEFEFYIP